MNGLYWLLSMLICLSAFASNTAYATHDQPAPTGEEIVGMVFSELEKQVMNRYFGVDVPDTGTQTPETSTAQDGVKNKNKGKDKKGNKNKQKELPPGLAKRKELPPGLAKRETLPPGLARRQLPEDLQLQLPAPVSGTERTIIDGSVVLIELATSKVLDILENVVRGDP